MDSREKLLEIKGLKTYFNTEDGVAKAVNGVDYHVYKGETLVWLENQDPVNQSLHCLS